MKRVKVAITIRSFDAEGPAMKKLLEYCEIIYKNSSGRRLAEDALIEAVEESNAIIAGTEPISRNVIEAAPHLEVISRVGVGIDSIDASAAAQRGILLFNTPDSPVQAVAEHTLALIFSVLKHVPHYNASLRQGNYTLRQGRLLAGKIVGVVGLGRIGFRVATLLDMLGCTIVYYDPYERQNVPGDWLRALSLEELVRSSEIITLHASPPVDGKPILNNEMIAACRRGVILINTARGSLIDEAALACALQEGTIAGAGMDVLAHEPASGPLLQFSQVVVTPHVASNTVETRREMEMEAVDNILKHYGGRIA